jgi:hypothetical protein
MESYNNTSITLDEREFTWMKHHREALCLSPGLESFGELRGKIFSSFIALFFFVVFGL